MAKLPKMDTKMDTDLEGCQLGEGKLVKAAARFPRVRACQLARRLVDIEMPSSGVRAEAELRRENHGDRVARAWLKTLGSGSHRGWNRGRSIDSDRVPSLP
ncbi:hypothetical protein E4U39_007466 [Claviceps sp. Clav50 group G5]|nr:hypothetical protein E4U39_007466 [Claviceps sp. Clav50 group G5]